MPRLTAVASVYGNLANIYLPPREAMPKAKAAATKALDEALSEAHISLAHVLLYYDWIGRKRKNT
jgi:hypothetical protein